MAARWHYSGDLNPENGGFWYRLGNWQYGYADLVRITPCADAGGPDNQFWLETGTVHSLDDEKRVSEALNSCGWVDETKQQTEAQKRHMIVSAMVGYGHYDIDGRETVQIGPKSTFFNWDSRGWDPLKTIDVQLRAGSDIGRYVRRAHLRNA